MNNKQIIYRKVIRRFIVLLVITSVLVLMVSEIAYRLQKEDTSRPPQVVEFTIPPGTSDRIEAGGEELEIPSEMVFVVGDTLQIRNDDRVDHQLGPLWIPAGRTATMHLDQVNNYTYECTFQASQFLDLTVKQPVTWKTRLQALFVAVPATVMFFFIYSFLVVPLKP